MKKLSPLKTAISFVLLLFAITLSGCKKPEDKNPKLRLWYDKPASDWMTEALPLGNGHLGVMFFGGVENEQLQFSEGTLWEGGPGADPRYNFGLRKGASKYLPEIRQLIAENKLVEANDLVKKELTGIIHTEKNGLAYGDYGAQQTMGDIFIKINNRGEVSNYVREIDLENGEGNVSYNIGKEHFSRKYFGCYPNNLMVYHFESSAATSYQLQYRTPHIKKTEKFNNNTYRCNARLSGNGMEFETCLKLDTDGTIEFRDSTIYISGAKVLNVYHTAATAYRMKHRTYDGNDYKAVNKKSLEAIEGKSYASILKSHQNDYSKLFDRVSLNLGDNNRDSIPTNRRLADFANGTNDPGLEAIYFQYSRYLMISASRPGTMPMHLQGKWNNSTNPPWACDYHTNINLQMIYWPAEITNLSECQLPLFAYMESLVEPGKAAAQCFFNTRGWTVNTMNNVFGYTSPGWNVPWGYFPGGAAWLCQHVWEHFLFTQDTTFLKNSGYPLMKSAALFWIDYLTEDENGYLVSCPSYSPEHGGISGGASMDHQIAWDILNNCVKACSVLNIDKKFKEKAVAIRDKILPPQIGKWGQLQEWKEDVDDPDNKHRHVSHLYALYPGNQITIGKTPELANAAEVTLNARGDGGTGWSLAWKINFWARLKNGDHAYKLFRRLLRPIKTHNTQMMNGGGSYDNLLCAHPPFQLDGNMGGCAGMAEMLLQSHEGTIELLPSLPSNWEKGMVTGLKARGKFEVDMEWKNNQLVLAKIKGKKNSRGTIKYAGKIQNFTISDDGSFLFELTN
ncbi:MAG: alpha-L-fucosidase [Draconibacterium sp.]|nr:MAG: alpha-L-fucosidase [Draconibacterium sp.]